MTHTAKAILFNPSGQRLIIAQEASICIIDIISGAMFHATPIINSSLTLMFMSWPEEDKLDDACDEDQLASTDHWLHPAMVEVGRLSETIQVILYEGYYRLCWLCQ